MGGEIMGRGGVRGEEADPLWGFEDLSAYVGIPVPTLRRWRSSGQGPRGIRMGKHVRFRRSECIRWVEAQELEQASA